jgi:hypothetical protein
VLAEIEIKKLLVPESRGKMMRQKFPVLKNAYLNRQNVESNWIEGIN